MVRLAKEEHQNLPQIPFILQVTMPPSPASCHKTKAHSSNRLVASTSTRASTSKTMPKRVLCEISKPATESLRYQRDKPADSNKKKITKRIIQFHLRTLLILRTGCKISLMLLKKKFRMRIILQVLTTCPTPWALTSALIIFLGFKEHRVSILCPKIKTSSICLIIIRPCQGFSMMEAQLHQISDANFRASKSVRIFNLSTRRGRVFS